jgi:hypothetical protein
MGEGWVWRSLRGGEKRRALDRRGKGRRQLSRYTEVVLALDGIGR